MKTITLEEVLQLPVSERIRIVEVIWDNIADSPEAVELTEDQKAELDLKDQQSVRAFFAAERPEVVCLAAAKVRGDKTVTLWDTGSPRREFLYSDDMAEACVKLLGYPHDNLAVMLPKDQAPLINIGSLPARAMR
jgi:NAD dependent epimerase/dehydratase family/Putative addiction module component